jgi:hypothetical protein
MADPFQKGQRKGEDPFQWKPSRRKATSPFGDGGRETLWEKTWGLLRSVLLYAVCVSILAGGIYVLWKWKARHPSHPAPLPDMARKIVDARGEGQYDKALELAAEELKNHPDTPAVKELSDQMLRDFRPDVRLECFKNGEPRSANSGPSHCAELKPGDQFFFTVLLPNGPRPYFVYMFLVDSAGNWAVLLPNKAYAPNLNPLPPALYEVPDNIQQRLTPPDTPGAEKLFVVIASWKIDALEDLSAKLAAEKDPARARDLGRQVQERLRLELAKPDELKGLKVGTREFHNSGRPSVEVGEKL